jgi:two-component system osmolarity sensor histidine kinase EnvZ
MAGPMGTESGPADPRGLAALRYGLAGLGLAALALVLLELLLGRRLAAQRQQTLAAELAAKIVLAELALERLTPATLAGIGGLHLALGRNPEASGRTSALPPDPAAPPEAGRGDARRADPALGRQALALRTLLCPRLGRCPSVRPALHPPRGVWVALDAPLEEAWLFVPLTPLPGWPPDPLLLALALGIGGLGSGLLYLNQEVRRPLARLSQAVGRVSLQPSGPEPLALEGSPAVRQLTARFNAMVERLERSGREQATMLAGIAHDLRSPLTRLRLRLDLAPAAGLAAADCRRGLRDLDALERITRQFLHYAGQDGDEPPVPVALDRLVAELASLADPVPLELALEPLQRVVRPTTLARALANLIDNALAHGAPPLRLDLTAEGPSGFVITVWDRGPGLAADAWERALEPFQRLDPSRTDQGHCGLGLAIAARIARDHGGGLEWRRGAAGFGVALHGRSHPLTLAP